MIMFQVPVGVLEHGVQLGLVLLLLCLLKTSLDSGPRTTLEKTLLRMQGQEVFFIGTKALEQAPEP